MSARDAACREKKKRMREDDFERTRARVSSRRAVWSTCGSYPSTSALSMHTCGACGPTPIISSMRAEEAT